MDTQSLKFFDQTATPVTRVIHGTDFADIVRGPVL